MANIKLSVNLDAAQATQVAGQLGTALAQASVNSHQIQVNPMPIEAAKGSAVDLNEQLKQIQISVERLNISLAKTAKLSFELNRGKGQLSADKKNALSQLDAMIANSEATIQQLSKNLNAGLQPVQQPAQQTAKEIKNVGDKAKEAADTGKGAFKGFTGQMKQSMNTAQALAKSFFSPITIAIIAFEAVVKTFTYFWDNLTQSIQKMTTRGQTAIKAIQRKQKALEQETKASRDLIKQLEELNKQEELSLDQQRLAESIIAKLNKQYKDLGITLDQTTGKYIGLYEAQRKIDERNKRAQANALKQEISAQRNIVNAALANAFGRGISLDKTVLGDDFFTLAEKMGGTLGADNADLLAKKWNTGDLEKQLEVIDQLIQGLSSSDKVIKNGPEAREALATLIDYRKQLQELNSVDTQIIDMNKRLADSFKEQADALKKTKEEIEGLTKSFEQQQRSNSLSQLDPEDRVNAIRAEVEALEKRNEVLNKTIDYGEGETVEKRANSEEALKWLKTYQDGMKQAEDTIKSVKEQMDETNKFISKYSTEAQDITPSNFKSYEQYAVAYRQNQANLQKYTKAQKDLQQELVSVQKQLNGFKKAANELEAEYQKQNGITLEHEQALANLEKERQQNLNAIQQKTQQIADLEKQIADAQRQAEQERLDKIQKQQEAIDSITKSYKEQIEALGKSDLENKIEEALQNAQKAKGDVLSRGQINDITMYITQLEKLKQLEEEKRKIEQQQKAMNQLFTSYQENQTLSYMKMVGHQKEAVLLEAKLNAEKAKGAKLTDAEVNALKQYLEVDDIISKFNDNQKVELDKPEVISNDLARKGGWASSVVVDRSVDINEQILKVEQSQKDVLTNIKDLVDRYSVIQ